VLVLEDGAALVGSEAILAYLDPLPEPSDAEAHRARAERSLRKRCAELRETVSR